MDSAIYLERTHKHNQSFLSWIMVSETYSQTCIPAILPLPSTHTYTHSLKPGSPLPIRAWKRSPSNATHFNVSENVIEYLIVWYAEGGVIIIGVGAGMDDTVHVKVEVIKLWNL